MGIKTKIYPKQINYDGNTLIDSTDVLKVKVDSNYGLDDTNENGIRIKVDDSTIGINNITHKLEIKSNYSGNFHQHVYKRELPITAYGADGQIAHGDGSDVKDVIGVFVNGVALRKAGGIPTLSGAGQDGDWFFSSSASKINISADYINDVADVAYIKVVS